MSKSAMESTKDTAVDSLKKNINENFIKTLKRDIFKNLNPEELHNSELSVIIFCYYIVEHLDVYIILRDMALDILNKTHINSENRNDLVLNLICKCFHEHLTDFLRAFLEFKTILHGLGEPSVKYERACQYLSLKEITIYNLFPKEHNIHQLITFDEKIERFKLQSETYEQSVYINKCEEFDGRRRTRRLDSLAKLLNLNSDFSVCSAVSIVNNQLLIACNINKNINPQEVASYIDRSFSLIQETIRELLEWDSLPRILRSDIEIDPTHLFKEGFIENVELHDLHRYFNPEYLSIVLKFLDNLNMEGGIFIKKTILFQAFTKLYVSIVSNSRQEIQAIDESIDDLTNMDINVLMGNETNPLILIPTRKETTGKLGIQAYCQENPTNSFLTFQEKEQTLEIHTFHAEQLIGFYIRNIMPECLNHKNKISIGISKPACADCTLVLKDEFLFRATSNVSFLNTACLSENHTPIKCAIEADNRKRPPLSPISQTSKRHSIDKPPSTPPELPNRQQKVNVTFLPPSPFLSPEQLRKTSISSYIDGNSASGMAREPLQFSNLNAHGCATRKGPSNSIQCHMDGNSASGMARATQDSYNSPRSSTRAPQTRAETSIDDNFFDQVHENLLRRTHHSSPSTAATGGNLLDLFSEGNSAQTSPDSNVNNVFLNQAFFISQRTSNRNSLVNRKPEDSSSSSPNPGRHA